MTSDYCTLRQTEADAPCNRVLIRIGRTTEHDLPVYVCPRCDGDIPAAKGKKAA